MQNINKHSLPSNIDIVHSFYISVFKKRDIEVCNESLSENYINHSGLVKNGRENFKNYFKQYYKTFSVIDTEIEHIFESNNLVCVYANHWASNKLFNVKFKAIDIYRIESGILVEHWDSIEAQNGFSRFMFAIKSILKL